ncbi:MAG: hypothetical protein AAGC60_17425 [Acidobacteriota bacterium]
MRPHATALRSPTRGTTTFAILGLLMAVVLAAVGPLAAAPAPIILQLQADGQIFTPRPGPDRVLNQAEFGAFLERESAPIALVVRRPEHLVYLESLRTHQVPEAGRWLETPDGVRVFQPIRIILPHNEHGATVVDWHRLNLVFYSADRRLGLSLMRGVRISTVEAREAWVPLRRFEAVAREIVPATSDEPIFVVIDENADPRVENEIFGALTAAGARDIHCAHVPTRPRPSAAPFIRVELER